MQSREKKFLSSRQSLPTRFSPCWFRGMYGPFSSLVHSPCCFAVSTTLLTTTAINHCNDTWVLTRPWSGLWFKSVISAARGPQEVLLKQWAVKLPSESSEWRVTFPGDSKHLWHTKLSVFTLTPQKSLECWRLSQWCGGHSMKQKSSDVSENTHVEERPQSTEKWGIWMRKKYTDYEDFTMEEWRMRTESWCPLFCSWRSYWWCEGHEFDPKRQV